MKKLFNVEKYTVEDLVGLLLIKLYRNGVKYIYEEELSEKLYYYSVNPQFEDLFVDIKKIEDEEKIDIKTAIYYEKYLSEGVKWSVVMPEKLLLSYSDYLDITSREKKLTEDGLNLINIMVEELTMRYKFESVNKTKLNIYGADPNQNYTLVHANNSGKILSSELITDGCMNVVHENTVSNPYDSCEQLALTETRIVKLRHANYAIVQNMVDGVIKNINIYTNIIDLDRLTKINDIANTLYQEANLLVNNRPYVRKITLN